MSFSRTPSGTLALSGLLLGLCRCGGQGIGIDDPDVAPLPYCGNGVVERGEGCDDGPDNSDLEPGACRTHCQVATCGDGVRDPGEACDGADLGGQTCAGLGFTSGTLACAGTCTLDVRLEHRLPVLPEPLR